jgi:hypothetical protein
MSDLVEEVKHWKSHQALVLGLERQVKQAAEQKQQLLEETAAINDLFDFSQIGGELPPLETPVLRKDDCGLELKRMRRVQQELLTVDCRTELTETERDAANAAKSVAKLQWQAAAAAPRVLKVDVNHLKKVAVEQEMALRKLDSDVTAQRRRLFQAAAHGDEDSLAGKVRADVSQEKLKSDIRQMDDEIARLQDQIERTAVHFTEIVQETKQIQSRELIIQVPQIEEEEEEEEEESRDESSESESTLSVLTDSPGYPERALILTRNELQFEIADLKTEIQKQRKTYKARELKLKAEIRSMYKLLAAHTEGIRIEQELCDDSSSSHVQEQMANLMLHINSSITDLRRELESA